MQANLPYRLDQWPLPLAFSQQHFPNHFLTLLLIHYTQTIGEFMLDTSMAFFPYHSDGSNPANLNNIIEVLV